MRSPPSLKILAWAALLPACAQLLGADFDVDRARSGAGAGGALAGAGNGEAGERASDGGAPAGGAGSDAGNAGASAAAGSGGSGPGPQPEDESLGTLLVAVDGEPTCSGVLLTNHWLLTRGACLAPEVVAADVELWSNGERDASYSIDLIVRPDLSAAERDLVLLHLGEPAAVGGSTTGFFRAYYPRASAQLEGEELHCVGFDLDAAVDSPPAGVRSLPLTVDSVEQDVADSGDRAWFVGQDAEALGALDAGSGCFVSIGDVWFLAALQVGHPEPYALVLGDSETRGFLTRALIEKHTPNPDHQSGPVALATNPSGDVELVWIDPGTFEIAHGTWDGTFSEEVIAPPEGPSGTVDEETPALAVTADGTLHVVITIGSPEQEHWYFQREPEQAGAWSAIDATQNVNSGSSLVPSSGGELVLLSRQGFELYYASYAAGWTATWAELYSSSTAHPTGVAWAEDALGVFGRSAGGVIYRAREGDTWQSWVELGAELPSDWAHRAVAATSLRPGRIDVFAQAAPAEASSTSTLVHRWFEAGEWVDEWVDTGLAVSMYSYLAGASGDTRVIIAASNLQENFDLYEFPRR
jgi:hypothetical protein